MPHILRMFFTAAGVMPISLAITLSKKAHLFGLEQCFFIAYAAAQLFSISVMD